MIITTTFQPTMMVAKKEKPSLSNQVVISESIASLRSRITKRVMSSMLLISHSKYHVQIKALLSHANVSS